MLIGETAKGVVRVIGSVGVGVSAEVVETVEEDGVWEERERGRERGMVRGDVTAVWVEGVVESVVANERPPDMGEGEERIAGEEEKGEREEDRIFIVCL